ncbi:MAG TPA: YkgJ family cysteine cluster protein [Kofleriaceae bacterium]|nr:YkgJ family cysteine cluster protein [Kofleriaceae bacterium]
MTRTSRDVDVEVALRRALLALESAREVDSERQAFVHALREEVTRLLGGADRHAEDAAVARIEARAAELYEGFREAAAVAPHRLQFGELVDKYAMPPLDGPPCGELIPICGARCCTFDFALTPQDLDEGVIAWDRDRPYLIRHGDDGACVHQDRATGFCGAYEHRPAICRRYDCREDPRIWADYEARILAEPGVADPPHWEGTLNLFELLRKRDDARAAERAALHPAPAPAPPPDDP